MTIIVFLIDNSGSMATKTVNGINYMDFVRQFVEAFLKQRQRDPISKNDRYMLMGFEEYPYNVKSGWKEAQSHFNEQLRQLRPSGASDFIEAFYNAIRFVNLNRAQTGIENYGYGRNPSYSEPVVFIAVVDYNNIDISEEFQDGFPALPQPLGELTDEPFRWDHRLFVVGLDIPGHPPLQDIEDWVDEDEDEEYPEDSPTFGHFHAKNVIAKVNGKLFRMKAAKQMNAVLDAILQKIQVNGVFVRLVQHGPDPATPKNPLPEPPKDGSEPITGIRVVDGEALDDFVMKSEQEQIKEEVLDETPVDWKKSVVLLHRGTKVHTNTQASWPIPEGYWPDQTTLQLPPRRVYPEILFRCDESEQVSTPGFPFDKYEVESGPLVDYVINRRDPSCCWQLFINNSFNRPGIGYPFGYMKAASNLQSVNVFIFPYNYPLLFAIIEECKDEKNRTTEAFRQKVDKYFRTIPHYYIASLRKCLSKYPIQHHLLDETKPHHFLHFSVVQSMSKAKTQGKEDFEKTCAEIQKMERRPYFSANMILPMAPVQRSLIPETLMQKKIGLLSSYKQQIQPLYKDATVAITPTRISKDTSQRFLNPYLVERDDIVDQLERMRVNFELNLSNSSIPVLEGGVPGQRIRLQHAEDLHAQPIQKMGDFNLYAKRLADIGFAPMRDFEPPQAKPHAFGNPFKLDKKSMPVDEVPPDLNEGPDTAQMPQNGKETAVKKEDRKRAASEPANGNPRMARRRVGPLDRDSLMRWKQRRLSNSSDAESIVSDIGYTRDLDDETEAKRPRYAASEPGDTAPTILDEDEEMPEEAREQVDQQDFSSISDEEMVDYKVSPGCSTTPSASSVISEDSGVRVDELIEEDRKPVKRLLNGKDNMKRMEKNGKNFNVQDENTPEEDVVVVRKKKRATIESSEEEDALEDDKSKVKLEKQDELEDDKGKIQRVQKSRVSKSDEDSEGHIEEDSIPILMKNPKQKTKEVEKSFKYDSREDVMNDLRRKHKKSNKATKKKKAQQNGDVNLVLEDGGNCTVVEGIYVPLVSSDEEEVPYLPDRQSKYMSRARLEKKARMESKRKPTGRTRNGQRKDSDDDEDEEDEDEEETDSSFSSSEEEEDLEQRKEQEKLLEDCFDDGKEKSASVEEETVGIKVPVCLKDLPSCSKEMEPPNPPMTPVKHHQDQPALNRVETVEVRCAIRCAVRNHSVFNDAYPVIRKLVQRASNREKLQLYSFAKVESSLHRRQDLEKQFDADVVRLNQLILVDDHIQQSLDDSARSNQSTRSLSSSPAHSESADDPTLPDS